MEKMKIALIADKLAPEAEIRSLLKKEVEILALSAEKLKENKKLIKDRDAVVFAASGPAPLKENLSLLRSMSDGGIPVFCITSFPFGSGRKNLDGISYLEFPADGDARRKQLFAKELVVKVKSVYGRVKKEEPAGEHLPSRFIVGIGASTGGPGALASILGDLPADTCGILVAQHMSPGFMDDLVSSLDTRCRMRVRMACPGELIRDGNIYFAPEGCQTEVCQRGCGYVLRLTPGKCGYEYCPSVDCLFASIAESAQGRAMGIVLTGMGDDGARGLLRMREAGAGTISQDRETSSIYSMPETALKLGGVLRQRPLGEIPREIMRFNEQMRAEYKN